MKHVKLFEQFVNEKVQMSGEFRAKGIAGKVLSAFKDKIERIKYEGDQEATLEEINQVWSRWADKDGAKIIEQEVLKQVKNKEAIVYVMATLGKTDWKVDTAEGINAPGNSKLLVRFPGDFVINVGFADDVDANKFSGKLGGMTNAALVTGKETTIIGAYDRLVRRNNVEIQAMLFLTIDAK